MKELSNKTLYRRTVMELDLKHIKGDTYYIPGPVNIGVVIKGSQAVVIDTGNDSSMGKKIHQLLIRKELSLVAIINTHSNADHIGGNHYLQSKTDCEIYATYKESFVINYPYIEPMFLYGAYPFNYIRNKYVEAKPSKVSKIIKPDETIQLMGKTFKFIDLEGHFWEQIGVHTEDNVVFLGDSLFSEQIISKYGFFFLYHVNGFLNTLSMLKNYNAAYYLPCHGQLSNEISDMVIANQVKVQENIDFIESLLIKPIGVDQLFQLVATRFGINGNATQYLILNGTIKAYLSYLMDEGRCRLIFDNGFGEFQRL